MKITKLLFLALLVWSCVRQKEMRSETSGWDLTVGEYGLSTEEMLGEMGENAKNWGPVLDFDIDMNKVGIIGVIGGVGLRTSGEMQHTVEELERKKYYPPHIEIAPKKKDDTLQAIRQAVADLRKDVSTIVLQMAGHGLTSARAYALRGASGDSAADDQFHFVIDDPKAMLRLSGTSHEVASTWLRRGIELPQKSKRGPTDCMGQKLIEGLRGSGADAFGDDLHYLRSLNLCDNSILEVKNQQTLANIVLAQFLVQDVPETIQSGALGKIIAEFPQTSFLIIVDACYAGSLLDDPIAKLPNVRAIIASTTASDPAADGHSTKGIGPFNFVFWSQVGQRRTIGEAFVRARYILAHDFAKIPVIEQVPVRDIVAEPPAGTQNLGAEEIVPWKTHESSQIDEQAHMIKRFITGLQKQVPVALFKVGEKEIFVDAE